MSILDSNLVILCVLPEHVELRRRLTRTRPIVSAVTLVEVLGYHRLSAEHKADFVEFFAAAEVLPLTEEVILKAVELRQARKMSLGDALIAATAVTAGHELLTHNVRDFTGIPSLTVSDPLTAGDTP